MGKKSLIISLTLLVFLVLSFQNCEEIKPKDTTTVQRTESSVSNGEPYEGMRFPLANREIEFNFIVPPADNGEMVASDVNLPEEALAATCTPVIPLITRISKAEFYVDESNNPIAVVHLGNDFFKVYDSTELQPVAGPGEQYDTNPMLRVDNSMFLQNIYFYGDDQLTITIVEVRGTGNPTDHEFSCEIIPMDTAN